MAAFGTAAGRPLQGRGAGSAGLRFALYAALSVVLMYLDTRQHYLGRLRYVLQAAAYPVQLVVNSPPAAWTWLHGSFETRDRLLAENASLRKQQRDLELRSMRYEDLVRENAELRGLRAALPPVADRWLPAEIVNVQLSSLRQRLLINRGAANGVFKAQAVLDDRGLIGQTVHVGPWSAEVILITDPEHGTPVRIERTGLRTIAVGAGDATYLALPYLPANADIRSGDLLVTSGLGGVFPQGYPVAKVTEVHRDAVQPLAQVRAAPLAHVATDSEVVLVWFRPDHPAAPAPATASADAVKAGNPDIQPQAVTARTAPAAQAASKPGPAGPKPAPAARTPVRKETESPKAPANDSQPPLPKGDASPPVAPPAQSPPQPQSTPPQPDSTPPRTESTPPQPRRNP